MGRARGGRGYVFGAAAVLFVGVALAVGSCTPARNAPPKVSSTSSADAMAVADTYAGAQTCKECHESSFNSFSKTKMGRIFMQLTLFRLPNMWKS